MNSLCVSRYGSSASANALHGTSPALCPSGQLAGIFEADFTRLGTAGFGDAHAGRTAPGFLSGRNNAGYADRAFW